MTSAAKENGGPRSGGEVFLPDGFDRTFGEMEAGEKHGWEAGRGDLGLSHRARAFAEFATQKLGANTERGA